MVMMMTLTMTMMMSRMMVARPKPVQIQQAIVMQWLKPDLQDHSHVYSSLNDDGDDHDGHHHYQHQEIGTLTDFM